MSHANSLAAHHTETASGGLSRRAQQILTAAESQLSGRPFTDREMMRRLGYSDPNAVRPRITELTAAGLLVEVGQVPDSVSGKSVRLSRAATHAEIAARAAPTRSEPEPEPRRPYQSELL
jgi:hypothetical protein